MANRNSAGGASHDESPGNRKLIRPNLSELAERYPTRTFAQRKQTPAEQTNAESYYYLKQMAAKTPMRRKRPTHRRGEAPARPHRAARRTPPREA